MIQFDLDRAHQDYQREIPKILAPLAERYPGAKLRSVSLYEQRFGDTSMGMTTDGGEIRLNPYWFARDPSHLRNASEHHAIIEIGGVQMGWHGPMLWEPRQVLTHEFGHVVALSLPRHLYRNWAGDRWLEATRNPYLAPSGYALAGNPPIDEFFGEMFALVHMGYATEDEEADLMDLIGRLQ